MFGERRAPGGPDCGTGRGRTARGASAGPPWFLQEGVVAAAIDQGVEADVRQMVGVGVAVADKIADFVVNRFQGAALGSRSSFPRPDGRRRLPTPQGLEQSDRRARRHGRDHSAFMGAQQRQTGRDSCFRASRTGSTRQNGRPVPVVQADAGKNPAGHDVIGDGFAYLIRPGAPRLGRRVAHPEAHSKVTLVPPLPGSSSNDLGNRLPWRPRRPPHPAIGMPVAYGAGKPSHTREGPCLIDFRCRETCGPHGCGAWSRHRSGA